MRAALRPHPGEAGFSLVELLVAIVILSIAMVGVFRVYDNAARAAGADRERALAGIVAQNRAEEIALHQGGLPGIVRMAGREWAIETAARATSGGFEEITITVRPATGGAGASLVTYAAAGEF